MASNTAPTVICFSGSSEVPRIPTLHMCRWASLAVVTQRITRDCGVISLVTSLLRPSLVGDVLDAICVYPTTTGGERTPYLDHVGNRGRLKLRASVHEASDVHRSPDLCLSSQIRNPKCRWVRNLNSAAMSEILMTQPRGQTLSPNQIRTDR